MTVPVRFPIYMTVFVTIVNRKGVNLVKTAENFDPILTICIYYDFSICIFAFY